MNIYIAGINIGEEQRQIMERAGTGSTEINFVAIAVILAIVLFVFWLWMLIDCLKRLDDNFAIGGNYAKLIWVLVIIFTGLIGALIYYFLIKRTDSHQDRLIGIALLASAAVVIILIASLFVLPSFVMPSSTYTSSGGAHSKFKSLWISRQFT